MSLRLRLLIAVGLVLAAALAIADIATYSVYGSYVDNQLDVVLRETSEPVQSCLDQGGRLTPSLIGDTSPGLFAETRSRSGQVLAVVNADSYDVKVAGIIRMPLLPAHLSAIGRLAQPPVDHSAMTDACQDSLQGRVLGPAHSSEDSRLHTIRVDRTAPELQTAADAAYFSAPARGKGSPYRVRVSLLASGAVLLLALPTTSTSASLSRLLATELLVSALALLAALGLAVVLVRIGLKPLVEVEQTAEQIMDGDLQARVPERFAPATEVGRLTVVLNSMLDRLATDLDEREQSEISLRRSEQRMRQFLADASHELRTPIAAVSAYAQLFATGAISQPEEVARVLSAVEGETARMGRLVSDLMLLANLDEGRPLDANQIEIVGICSEAVQAGLMVGPQWPVELVATEPVDMVGDATRLRQVFDNLLANVRAHTPPGTSATVTIWRELGDERGDCVVIEVSDNGPGIEGEERERVFERFFRQDTSRARASGGSGLGLAIVRAIVEAHGGEVSVSSPPARGASFSLRLPLSGPPVRPATVRSGPVRSDSVRSGPVRSEKGAAPRQS